uniref:uncharacterized protein n=1 Tax=Myxine glutinosa TaxID=7769 RepID=UPI00358DE152
MAVINSRMKLIFLGLSTCSVSILIWFATQGQFELVKNPRKSPFFHQFHESVNLVSTSSDLSGQTFVRVENSSILVFSAYLDERDKDEPRVRVFALAPWAQRMSLCCHLLYNDRFTVRSLKEAKREIVGKHYDFKFAVFNFFCKVYRSNLQLTHVALTRCDQAIHPLTNYLPIQAPPKLSPQHDFAVCLPALFGQFDNTLQFVQSMEMYRILGATSVTVYNTSVSHTMDIILRAYIEIGILEVIQWPIANYLRPSFGWRPSKHPGDIQYFGQIATINDCLYRNKHRTKYIAFIDVDEIIVPHKWNNWSAMMEDLAMPQVACWYILHHTFPITNAHYNTMTSEGGLVLKGTDILKAKTMFPPIERSWAKKPKKVMIKPSGIVYHGVADVTKYQFGYKDSHVPMSDASSHHYKKWGIDWPSYSLFNSTFIHPYIDTLQSNINKFMDFVDSFFF